MKTFTDEEIVQGLRQKEDRLHDKIITFLYKDCKEMVHRMVRKNSGSDEEADDLFQEVIMDFISNVWSEKFVQEAGAKIKTYLYQMAYLKWMKELKKRKKRTIRDWLFTEKQKPEENPYAQETDETVRAMWIFNKLGEKSKRLLTAFYLEKKSLKEIAETFDYNSVQYAKTAKFRCMQELKKLVHQL